MPKTFRNFRQIALEKGTVPAGFDGQAYPATGPMPAQAGYKDSVAESGAALDGAAGAPVDTNGSMFKLDGGNS